MFFVCVHREYAIAEGLVHSLKEMQRIIFLLLANEVQNKVRRRGYAKVLQSSLNGIQSLGKSFGIT